jgi:hypothetical protein
MQNELILSDQLVLYIGATGFEPATSASRTRHSIQAELRSVRNFRTGAKAPESDEYYVQSARFCQVRLCGHRLNSAKNRLYVEYLARIEDIVGIHRPFNRTEHVQVSLRYEHRHVLLAFVPDPMLTAASPAQGGGKFEQLV